MFWTNERLDLLESMSSKPVEEIAAHFGKTVKSIRGAASTYGISLQFYKKSWTPEQDLYVRRQAGNMKPEDIAKAVGHSKAALTYRASYILNVSLRKRKRK